MARLMKARFPGPCAAANCDRRIQEGDLIVFDGKARHRQCCPTNGNYQWAKRSTTKRAEAHIEDRREARESEQRQINAEVAKVTQAAQELMPLHLITDGIREDEALTEQQKTALIAYAKAACSMAEGDASREQMIAEGHCPGNLAEARMVCDEWAYDTRRKAEAAFT